MVKGPFFNKVNMNFEEEVKFFKFCDWLILLIGSQWFDGLKIPEN